MYYYLRRDFNFVFSLFAKIFLSRLRAANFRRRLQKPISIESYLLCVVVTKDESTHISYPAKKT